MPACGVTLLSVGRLKEKYYIEAFAEYQKRLGAYCRFEALELPEQRLPDDPSEKEIAAALKKEASALRAHIPDGAVVAALCVEGGQMSSEAFAGQLGRWLGAGRSRICFLVGGSYGLDAGLKASADLRLSVSAMTFPHHLFRVMLAEQIYRAFTILAGSRYHK